ncbi:hypothetical protein C8T65DRAFT_702480 [Cerioporus squamosus]|nr:hypothetical protein C8T65DRAFT_702480 [Cerioporus squamosus]
MYFDTSPDDDAVSRSSPEPQSESPDPWQPLEAYVPSRKVQRPYKVFLQELISESDDGNSQTFRANLHIVKESGLSSDEKRDVVCKVAFGEHRIELLKKEADLYGTKLSHLQNQVVPWMYGCYVGSTVDGRTGVLVLQYCSVPLSSWLKYYSRDIRFQAVNALLDIHKAGVQHNDFVERNLVVSKDVDGNLHVRVVDFGNACDHTCQVQCDVIKLYDMEPRQVDFDCGELYNVCLEAEVWRDRSVYCFGRYIPVANATSAESLLSYAGISTGEDEDNAKRIAKEVVQELTLSWQRRRAQYAHPVPIRWGDDVDEDNDDVHDDDDDIQNEDGADD